MWPVHHLLFVIASVTLTHASYNIDDRNSSIHYSVGSIGWDHKDPSIPNNSADPNRCYDQTYTVNHFLCTDSDGCYFQIPFTGSGITIYAIQSPDPVSTKMTIDGQSSSAHSLDPVGAFQYNVVLYDVQSLPYADHILDVALVNYIYANGTSMGSLIRFDYAAVNDTGSPVVAQPSPGPSPGPSQSPSPSPSPGPSPSHSHSVIPIAVGGAIGGIAVIALAVLAIYCCRGRRKSRGVHEVDGEPRLNVSALTPHALYGSSSTTYSQPARSHTNSLLSSSSSPISGYGRPQSLLATSRAPGAPLISSSESGIVTPFTSGGGQRMSDTPSASLLSKAAEGHNLLASSPNWGEPAPSPDPHSYPSMATRASYTHSAAASSSSSPILLSTSGQTEDQAQLVQYLHSRNVPDAEIARLIANMTGGRAAAFLNPEVHADHGDDAPPSYDFKGST